MRRRLDNQKGAALAMVLVVMAVLMILGAVGLQIAAAETNFATRQENKMQAYYLARSGAQAVAEYMMNDANNDAAGMIGKQSDWNEQIDGGRFRVTVSDDPANGVVRINSVGEVRGINQTAAIQLKRSGAGIGGIFKHAIAVKSGITVSGNGNKTEILGSVATQQGEINLEKATCTEPAVIDPTMVFPPIVQPPDRTLSVPYDLTYGNISSGVNVLTSSGKQTYILTGDIEIEKNKICVTGNGIAHMYVMGQIVLGPDSQFEVDLTAKLYVYVIGGGDVKLWGSGAQSNIFLYAPDSLIEWNNAQPSNDFYGAIIGKEVVLYNQLQIRHNPDMVNEVELDKTGVGPTFSGYIWTD